MKRWLTIVIAPDGRPCDWTLAESDEAAIAKLTSIPAQWPFARAHGYFLSWRRRQTNAELRAHEPPA